MSPENKPLLQLDWAANNWVIRLGLGFGLIIALAVLLTLTARDALKANAALGLAVNVTINLVPVLAAAVGAYLAPHRKMIVGTACGLLSMLPSLLIALLMLGYFAPLILVPMLLSMMILSVYTMIGAAIGTLLSKAIVALR